MMILGGRVARSDSLLGPGSPNYWLTIRLLNAVGLSPWLFRKHLMSSFWSWPAILCAYWDCCDWLRAAELKVKLFDEFRCWLVFLSTLSLLNFKKFIVVILLHGFLLKREPSLSTSDEIATSSFSRFSPFSSLCWFELAISVPSASWQLDSSKIREFVKFSYTSWDFLTEPSMKFSIIAGSISTCGVCREDWDLYEGWFSSKVCLH